MKPRLPAWLSVATVLVLGSGSVMAAFTAGSIVYTKKFETPLRKAPQPIADETLRVPAGKKLKVDEVRGAWLHVSGDSGAGWVFSGNLSDTKPVEIKGLDGLPIAASKTTATAAARPIAPVAAGYATRRSLATAREDTEWLLLQARALTDDDLRAFLQETKKGEFQ